MKNNSSKILQSVTTRVLFDLGNKHRPNYSLLGGDLGEAIYLYCASDYGLCSRDSADEAMDSILASIRQNPIVTTYCNGIAGLCIGLNWLESAGYIEGASESTSVYDRLLEHKLTHMLDSNLDFLHGAIGVGLYFVTKAKTDQTANMIVKSIINHLSSCCNINEDGGIYWKYPDRYGILEENLSLSHGISSTALFLARAHRILNSEEKSTCSRLLAGIAEYLKSNLKNPEELGCYTPMHPNGNKSRLGWCYGDIGTSIAFRAIGDCLGDDKLLKISHDIAVHTATHRNNLMSDFIFDACQCHGASGVAHYFKNCGLYYDEPLFEKAYEKWRDLTVGMYGNFDGEFMFGNFRYDDMKKHRSLCLLEGDTGVALMMMGHHTLIDNLLLYEY